MGYKAEQKTPARLGWEVNGQKHETALIRSLLLRQLNITTLM
jgi:hypothetical protein